ncbi:acetolactate synthase small subunit [Brochothrix thermosphacta]|uniref:acetolactate synthase small subunit n=1 Tax=Brochothrix thermosphacta TaxID=2756 RepID=UPI00083F5FBC|nr:acetolactate synthase small subunit [Brochothrix thermosphacta]ODJ59742.1 acetolactate synthase small subunit [Brochothrix thermosphacta]
MKRILIARLSDSPGVLNRAINAISKRFINIESIAVGQTAEENKSQLTLVVHVEDIESCDHLVKLLNKQVDVMEAKDITDDNVLTRELAIVDVAVNYSAIADLLVSFQVAILAEEIDNTVIQATGTHQQIEDFIEILKPYTITQLTRTGIAGFVKTH